MLDPSSIFVSSTVLFFEVAWSENELATQLNSNMILPSLLPIQAVFFSLLYFLFYIFNQL